jgi:hypothetical protein
MAVTLTLVDDVGTGGDATGLAYPSTAFTAGTVYFVSAIMRTSSGNPDIPVPSLTNSAWFTITTGLHPSAANFRFCAWMFVVSVDTTGILTIASSLSRAHQIGSHLVGGTGHDDTLRIVRYIIGSQALNISSAFTIDFGSASTTGNAMLWMSGHDGYSQTPSSGYTQLADTTGAPETSEFTMWRNDAAQAGTATAPGADGLGIGVLIEIPVAPASTTPWRPNTVWFNQT